MQVEMRGIDKAFGSNQVLKNAGFELRDGEIHALMGENGAYDKCNWYQNHIRWY